MVGLFLLTSLCALVHLEFGMVSSRQLKSGYFVLEALNSFATVYYLYYVYFLMQQDYGFGKKANLALAAWNGAVNAFGSWQGGKMAQRFGYFFALKAGLMVMLLALTAGAFAQSAAAHIVAMSVMIFGMSLTWPTLEAMISEGETPAGVPHMVGLYNIVWAATGALAYFFGGALIAALGFKSMYYLPAIFMAIELGFTIWLQRNLEPFSYRTGECTSFEGFALQSGPPQPTANGKMFLRMAWLANPFAYIAINTTIALVPSVASRFGLSTTLAGIYCSLWCFTRLAAFYGLWRWDGWHYNFRWLIAAYIALIGSFVLIVVSPHIFVLIFAQIFFGIALGLIYYSSLFYSMDLSDTKGEHGGLHEAAIGLGNMAGPAVGAASLHFFPHYAHSGVLAVGLLLLIGLGGLFSIRSAGR